VADHLLIGDDVDPALAAIGFDSQTSGGLLAAVVPTAVDELRAAGFVPVGEVLGADPAIALR
jgi:uncharacterized protein YidB (DUF937 family)